MGSALPALRRTVDLQEKSQSLVVLSCHLPGGSQRTLGAAQEGAACSALRPLARPGHWLPAGTVPAPLPRKGCYTKGSRSAGLGHSSLPWVASLGVPQRGPEAWRLVVRTQKWPRCLGFMGEPRAWERLGACPWDLGALKDMGQKPPKQPGWTWGPCFLGFLPKRFN